MSAETTMPEKIATDIYWDGKNSTLYLRSGGLSSSDQASFITRFRQALENDPDNAGVRFLLATYLEQSGQRQEAQIELKRVALSQDTTWSEKAQVIINGRLDGTAT